VSPARSDGRWLVDGGLCNPVPVSLCRALGAEVIIAVNLNGDLLGRRFQEEQKAADSGLPLHPSIEFLSGMLGGLPAALRSQAAQITERLLPHGPASPGYFDVLANSINIMQDQITRARLAGEPPHVLISPRLGKLGLMEFHRAAEAMEEGHASAMQAMPAILRSIGRG
jgi:NTE family protein